VAQILQDKAHWIFEADEMPVWPPYADGSEPVLVDITAMPDVAEGWLYDAEAGEFAPPEPVEIPVAEISLDEAKAAKKQEMETAKAAVLATGIEVETSIGVKRFALGKDIKADLTGLNVAALFMPDAMAGGIPYHTMDDGHIYWSAEDFAAISRASLAQIMAQDIYAEAITRYVDTLDSVEAVQAVTYGISQENLCGVLCYRWAMTI